MIKKINGLKEVLNKYDVFFIDIWGVLHDGVNLFPNVLNTLKFLNDHHKKIIILSNAPRRIDASIKKLTLMGLDHSYYHGLYTAGEHCYSYLQKEFVKNHSGIGLKYYHFGFNKKSDLVDDLPFTHTNDIEKSDFFLLTGLPIFEEITKEHQKLLHDGIKKKLPLICANRDKVVRFNQKNLLCAGTIGHMYQQMGGEVLLYGKPDPLIYELALLTVYKSVLPLKEKMVMIGDGIETDMVGAKNFGIDSILISTGIHYNDLHHGLNASIFSFFDHFQAFPTYFLSELTI
jgi:HAD superfamily hydrolase (TIGR01459 family)